MQNRNDSKSKTKFGNINNINEIENLIKYNKWEEAKVIFIKVIDINDIKAIKENIWDNETFFHYFFNLLSKKIFEFSALEELFNCDLLNSIINIEFKERITFKLYLKCFKIYFKYKLSDVISKGYIELNKNKELEEFSPLFLKYFYHFLDFKSYSLVINENNIINLRYYLINLYQIYRCSYLFIDTLNYLKIISEILQLISNEYLKYIKDNINKCRVQNNFYINLIEIKVKLALIVIFSIDLCLNKIFSLNNKDYEEVKNNKVKDKIKDLKEWINSFIQSSIYIFSVDDFYEIRKLIYTAKDEKIKDKFFKIYYKYKGVYYQYYDKLNNKDYYLNVKSIHYIKKAFVVSKYKNNLLKKIFRFDYIPKLEDIKVIYNKNFKGIDIVTFKIKELEPTYKFFKDIYNFLKSNFSYLSRLMYDKNFIAFINYYNNNINPIDFSYSLRYIIENNIEGLIFLEYHCETFHEDIFPDLFNFENLVIENNKNNKYLYLKMKIIAIINYIEIYEFIISIYSLPNIILDNIKRFITDYLLPLFEQPILFYDEDSNEIHFFDEILNENIDILNLSNYVHEFWVNRSLSKSKNTSKNLIILLKLRILKFFRRININFFVNPEEIDILNIFNTSIEKLIEFFNYLSINYESQIGNVYIYEVIYQLFNFNKKKIIIGDCLDIYCNFISILSDEIKLRDISKIMSIEKKDWIYKEYFIDICVQIINRLDEESNYLFFIENIKDYFTSLIYNCDKNGYEFNENITYFNKLKLIFINEHSSDKPELENENEESLILIFKSEVKKNDLTDNYKLIDIHMPRFNNSNLYPILKTYLFSYESKEFFEKDQNFMLSFFSYLKNMKEFYFDCPNKKYYQTEQCFWSLSIEDKQIMIIKNVFDLFTLLLKGNKFSESNKKKNSDKKEKKFDVESLKPLSGILKLINNLFDNNQNVDIVNIFFNDYFKNKINNINYLMKSVLKKNLKESNIFLLNYFQLYLSLISSNKFAHKKFLNKYLDIEELYYVICSLVLEYYKENTILKDQNNVLTNEFNNNPNNNQKNNQNNDPNNAKHNNKIAPIKTEELKSLGNYLINNQKNIQNDITYKKLINIYINKSNDDLNSENLNGAIVLFSKINDIKSDVLIISAFLDNLKFNYKIYWKKRLKTNLNDLTINKIFDFEIIPQIEIFEFLYTTNSSLRIAYKNKERKIYFSKIPQSLFIQDKVKEEYLQNYDFSNIETKNNELIRNFQLFEKYADIEYTIYKNSNFWSRLFQSKEDNYKYVQWLLWVLGFIFNILNLATFVNTNNVVIFSSINNKLALNILNYVILFISFIFLTFWVIFRYKYKYEIGKVKYAINNSKDIDEFKPNFKEIIEIYILKAIVFNTIPISYVFHLSITILYYFEFYSFSSLHIFSLIFLSNVIKFIVGSITKQISNFLSALILVGLFIYSYSNLIIQFFRSDFNVGPNYCNNYIFCFINTLNLGFRNEDGLGGLMKPLQWSETGYLLRFFLDIIFFIIIKIFFLNIIQSIIIDQFNSSREESLFRKYDRENICMICGIERKFFVAKNKNFDFHLESTHNFMDYYHFYSYIQNKDKNYKEQSKGDDIKKLNLKIYELNKIETYIMNQLDNKSTLWFPKFELNEADDNNKKKYKNIVKLINSIQDLQKEN